VKSRFVLVISANIIGAYQVVIKKLRHMEHPDKPLRFDWILPWRPKNLEELDDIIRLNARSRDVRILRAYLLGQAIKVAREDPEQWISYSRREEWYRNAGRWRYWPARARRMYSSMISAVDQLASVDLIDSRVMPPGHLKIQSTFRATPKLMALAAENHMPLILDNPEIIILRDDNGRPLPYDDTREVTRMRRGLEEYNEAAAALNVSIGGQRIIEGEPLDFGKNRVGAATLRAVRIFNEDFRHGGRCYGPAIQSAPKELRRTIKIEDSSTEEPDYPSLHPQLLYAQAGMPLPADPYDVHGWDRDTVKPAFNIMLNAKTPKAALGAIMDNVFNGRTRGHRETAQRLMAEIERKHAPVAEYFGSGIGHRFQRLDSEMMRHVLARGLKDDECLLPIHDSVRARSRYEGKARENMDEAFEKVVGKPPTRRCSFSARYVIDKSTYNLKNTPQNGTGTGLVVGWSPGLLPLPASVVVGLLAGLASLVVVSSFYSGSVIGLERAA
jgi:hypothetical protein